MSRSAALSCLLLIAAIAWVVVEGSRGDDPEPKQTIESAAAHEPPPGRSPSEPGALRSTAALPVGPVVGRMAVEDGSAAVGVRVELHGNDATPVASAVSGSDGAFAMPVVPAGTYTIQVAAQPPYAAKTVSIVVPTPALVVTLDLAFEIVVHVADRTVKPGGMDRAVASATVELVDADDGKQQRAAAVTDRQGVARLSAIPRGDHRLRVAAPGFVPHEQALSCDATRLTTDPHLRGRAIVVELARVGASLAGFVLDAHGQGVGGALVVIDSRVEDAGPARTRPVRSAARDRLPWAVTDAGGRFAIEAVQGVAAQRLLICSGRDDLPLLVRRSLSAAEMTSGVDLEIRLLPGRRVEFRCELPDGSLGAGRVDVFDGNWAQDLAADPYLAHVPDLGRWNRVERAPGRLVLPMAAGSYKVRFTANETAQSKAFFVTLPADGPTTQVLAIGP